MRASRLLVATALVAPSHHDDEHLHHDHSAADDHDHLHHDHAAADDHDYDHLDHRHDHDEHHHYP